MKEYRIKYVIREIGGAVLLTGHNDEMVMASSADEAIEKAVAESAEIYRERFDEVVPMKNRIYVRHGDANVLEFYSTERWG